MNILSILKIIVAVGTAATGVVSLIAPKAVQGFTGLTAPGGRGLTEIRAILGGTFIGLGVAPFLFSNPAAYQVLGFTYLVVAATRLIGIVIDKSVEQSNIISIVVEFVFGIIAII